jgi:hypothetical protein
VDAAISECRFMSRASQPIEINNPCNRRAWFMYSVPTYMDLHANTLNALYTDWKPWLLILIHGMPTSFSILCRLEWPPSPISFRHSHCHSIGRLTQQFTCTPAQVGKVAWPTAHGSPLNDLRAGGRRLAWFGPCTHPLRPGL